MPRYVVYSPGRTGSTIICRNINSYYGHDAAYAVHKSDFIHSDAFIPLGDDLVCILSTRKNIFEAALSQLVLERTDEPTDYTNKHIDPFVADLDRFDGLVKTYKSFYNDIDISQYKSVVEVNFENMFEDKKYLFNQISIDNDMDYTKCIKSPYNYYTLIKNIKVLENKFNELR